MKIVLINASTRKNGATAKILEKFAENLSIKGDVEVESINLSDYKLNFCMGCCLCYKTGVCHIDDDAEMLSDLISDADGLIIGTPTLVSNVPGQLKTLIDRGHFVIEQLLNGKYTIGVVTYENAGGGAALKVLRKLFVYSGANRFEKLLVKLPFNSNPIANPKTSAMINKKSEKLYRSITMKSPPSAVIAITRFVGFHYVIKPFVLKKGSQYDGVLKHWQKRNIAYE